MKLDNQPVPLRRFLSARDIIYGAVLGAVTTLLFSHPWNVDHSEQVDYTVMMICPDGYVQQVRETRWLPEQHYTVDCDRDTVEHSRPEVIDLGRPPRPSD